MTCFFGSQLQVNQVFPSLQLQELDSKFRPVIAFNPLPTEAINGGIEEDVTPFNSLSIEEYSS